MRVALSAAITRAGGVVLSVTLRSATLEDAFLQMTRGSRLPPLGAAKACGTEGMHPRAELSLPEGERVATG